MEVEEFTGLIKNVTAVIADNNLNEELADLLNLKFPENGSTFNDIQKSCLSGIEAGWMCNNVAGSIRFGRVIKDVDGFSVDVVLMDEVVGPHHRHPKGEIDMVMPVSERATFDGNGVGWVVYPPGSAHKPTVKNGKAIVLYLLPEGEIEFTRS